MPENDEGCETCGSEDVETSQSHGGGSLIFEECFKDDELSYCCNCYVGN